MTQNKTGRFEKEPNETSENKKLWLLNLKTQWMTDVLLRCTLEMCMALGTNIGYLNNQ